MNSVYESHARLSADAEWRVHSASSQYFDTENELQNNVFVVRGRLTKSKDCFPSLLHAHPPKYTLPRWGHGGN